ncbi:MAG: hypothetical protein LBS10_00075 [Gracilibacteraceae bacterium]|nr:hypothetical protein [Gracilibacteraceae bacterium]
MSKRKQKPDRPRTFAERVAAEKVRRQQQNKQISPELNFVFRFGLVFMVIFVAAWPLSAKIDFPLSYCLSLFMYVLLGWLLWRRPRLVVEVITRRGGELDEPSLEKITLRLRVAGIILLVLGLVLAVATAANLSGWR